MNKFGNLCRTIEARQILVEELAAAEQHMATIPWSRLKQRRNQRKEIRSLRGKIEERNGRINNEAAIGLANTIAPSLWRAAAASVIPNQNTHGRSAQKQFDTILDLALKSCRDYVVVANGTAYRLEDLPEVEAILTRDFIGSIANRTIADRLAIATSPALIHKYVNYQGKQALMIQHVASGLRGLFAWDGQGFGSVDSKSSTLDSIDPANPGELVVWEPVVGLGIGPRIYAEAHRLKPYVRWPLGLHSPYAASVRRRLHVADPYIWEGPCKWCKVNLPQRGVHHWMDAVPSSFLGHPK